MKGMQRVLIVACAALLMSAGAWAQLTKGFRGRLLDMQGKGVAGVTVTFVDESNPGNHYEVVTDKDGSFAQTGLPFSERGYKITAKVPGLPDMLRMERPKLMEVMDLLMDPRKDIAFMGTVKDAAGQPLSGVKVTIVNLAEETKPKSVKTDNKGRYKSEGWPFTDKGYKITAEIPGGDPKIKTIGISMIGPLDVSFDPTSSSDTGTAASTSSAAADAKKLYDLGDFDGAISSADATMADAAEAPENKKAARLIKAKSLQKLERNDEAIAIFEEVYKESPEDLNVLGELVQLYEKKGDKAKAEQYKKLFVAKGGAVQGQTYNDGVNAFNSGEFTKAEELFKRAIAEDPNEADSHRELARTYVGLSKFPEAVTELKAYLSMKPNAPDAETMKQALAGLEAMLAQPEQPKKRR